MIVTPINLNILNKVSWLVGYLYFISLPSSCAYFRKKVYIC